MKRTREDDESKLSSDEIRKIIADIRGMVGSEKRKRDLCEKKYPDFFVKCPHLCKLACEETFDFAQLDYMLAMRDSIDKKERSFEDASKEVGEVMFDKYIKDKISHLPQPPEKL